MNENISIIAVFLEGLLSFFSPCILPLIPLYLAYLTSSCRTIDEDGNVSYDRMKVMITTNFFVLGISMVFVIMGISITFVKEFISDYQILITILGGVFLVVMALNQFGLISIAALNSTKKIDVNTKGEMTWLKAFLMGFAFSFAWSPCVGPILASVLSLAATAEGTLGYLYILFYGLGFVIPFLVLGMFTEKALNFIKKNQNIVSWTTKIAAAIILVLGLSMIIDGSKSIKQLQAQPVVESDPYSYSLADIDGNVHTLEENEGKYLYLSFSASWCPHCEDQIPDFQEFEAKYDEVNWFVVYSPESSKVSLEKLYEYIEEQGIEANVLIDLNDELAIRYQVAGFPTTYIFTPDGKPYQYIPGGVELEMLEQIHTSVLDSYIEE
jgi:cytochrome c-type biogenesis protein